MTIKDPMDEKGSKRIIGIIPLMSPPHYNLVGWSIYLPLNL
jgi:hypothetical protein